MLCENCHQREATHHEHIFNFTADGGEHGSAQLADAPSESNLCEVCFEDPSPDTREMTAAWKAGCSYCGGEPIMTMSNLSGVTSHERKTTVLCERCSREFSRCLKLKFPGVADDSITPEQMAGLKAIFSEIHDHLKKWVSERAEQ